MKNPITFDAEKMLFIHITKNAGSSIEEALFDAGIKVGRFDHRFPKSARAFWHLKLSSRSDSEIEAIKNEDSFAIIRNPLDRVVSEYNCKWGNKIAQSKDKRVINYVIAKYLFETLGILNKSSATGHWERQWDFVAWNNKLIVRNLLAFEHLEVEWLCFAKERELPVKLAHSNASKKYASINDLYIITKILVKITYWRDYKLCRRLKKIKFSAENFG